jgi:hypothetical protein
MPLSALDDGSRQPTAADLEVMLGRSHASWSKLISLVGNRIEGIAPLWKFSGKSTGWGMRLVDRGRVIVYMTPQRGQFLVSFVLGDRAVSAAAAAKLPAAIRQAIDAAPRYAEGRGVRLAVRNAALLPALARLAEIKRDH